MPWFVLGSLVATPLGKSRGVHRDLARMISHRGMAYAVGRVFSMARVDGSFFSTKSEMDDWMTIWANPS